MFYRVPVFDRDIDYGIPGRVQVISEAAQFTVKMDFNHQLSPTDERKDSHPVPVLQGFGLFLPFAVYHEYANFLTGDFESAHQVAEGSLIVQFKGEGLTVSGTGVILAQAGEKPYFDLVHNPSWLISDYTVFLQNEESPLLGRGLVVRLLFRF
jgi:hypothetical protein